MSNSNEIHVRVEADVKRWLKRRCAESLRSINQEIQYILQQERTRDPKEAAK